MGKALRRSRLIVAAVLVGMSAVGRGQASRVAAPVTIEYYYKLVSGAITPGGSGEWLALYRKNHNPILKQLMKEGLILGERAYERRFHAQNPAWDIKIVMVWRDWAALEEAQAHEPEIIHSLYPNKSEHDREEKRRWELTESHWDDVLKEVPLD